MSYRVARVDIATRLELLLGSLSLAFQAYGFLSELLVSTVVDYAMVCPRPISFTSASEIHVIPGISEGKSYCSLPCPPASWFTIQTTRRMFRISLSFCFVLAR